MECEGQTFFEKLSHSMLRCTVEQRLKQALQTSDSQQPTNLQTCPQILPSFLLRRMQFPKQVVQRC
jgi:hypothetical protein